MSEQTPEDQTPAPGEAEMLEALQQENAQLKAKMDELVSAQEELADQEERLREAVELNDQLRQRYADVALKQAVGEAATNLGLSREAAGIYTRRFRCEIDADGTARVEPNPTEFLLAELRENPLLRQSVSRGRQERQAAAVVHGAADVDDADPVELLAVLDRHPARKAQFIRRHGTQAFVDLARKARPDGGKESSCLVCQA
jgi:hypothetical protein